MSYFEDASINNDADSFDRTDLTNHRKFMGDLIAAWRTAADGKVAIGEVKVPTGVAINSKNLKDRGRDEYADERGFRKVASQMGVGVRITHRHLSDGRTLLRVSPQDKREFSDEAVAKRTAALEKRRERLAIEKYAQDNNKVVTQLTREDVQKALTAYRSARKAAEAKKQQGK